MKRIIPGFFKLVVVCLVLAAPMVLRAQDNAQALGMLPSVQFKGRMVKLSKSATQLLGVVADKVRRNPTTKLAVIGHGASSKGDQQLSWDRVNAVIRFLNEKEGISEERFIFRYGQPGDVQIVDLEDGTNEEGSNMVPAPHPNLRTIQRR
jgi:OmpA-OmpF porin, OOP family